MALIEIHQPAPDFTLEDVSGNTISLSQYKDDKNVILVLNRGFVWPFCQKHMAQLRRDHQKFIDANAVILVIGPESPTAYKAYFEKEQLPFVGLPDPDHKVLKLFGQKVNLFKLGRMPGQMIVDKTGSVRFIHYGHDMTDIPSNEEILELLQKINAEN